jgi:hypothetical protein
MKSKIMLMSAFLLTGGDYYCDANYVGHFCPEYDLYEGNKYTMVSTLHTCDKAPPNHYTNCDRGGCGSNAYFVNPKMMCPEESCTINTSKPYKIFHTHRTVFKLSKQHKFAFKEASFTDFEEH